MSGTDDHYPLYDLRVETLEPGGGKPFICRHVVGDYFTVTNDDLIEFGPGVRFPMYSMAALMMFLPAKQRDLHPNDWMASDDVLACTDPHCGGRFKVIRQARRMHSHGANSAVALVKDGSDGEGRT